MKNIHRKANSMTQKNYRNYKREASLRSQAFTFRRLLILNRFFMLPTYHYKENDSAMNMRFTTAETIKGRAGKNYKARPTVLL